MLNANISGFLNINKPVGPTSHDIVDKLRKITEIRKIGHAGTLDPFASGILLMAIGRESTKKISHFVKQDKEYITTLHLGITTDSYDTEGRIVDEKKDMNIPTLEEVNQVLNKFIGKQKQTPPMFSAKKVNGKKLYELARAGVEIKREASDIKIFNIKLLNYKWPYLEIKINCSTGTYIRSLGFDIGEQLKVGAHLKKLTRTKIGDFDIKKAINLDNINSQNWSSYLIKN